MRLFKTSAGRYINLDRMTSVTGFQIHFDELGGDNDNYIQLKCEDRDRLETILDQAIVPEPQPVVSRPDMAELALKLYQATSRVLGSVTDTWTDTVHEISPDVLNRLEEAHNDAKAALAEAGLLGDEPEAREVYDGFGPMGPPNADITEGVDPDLYAHAPYCDCLSCAGVEE